jgi:diaminohydroxyphosphoribosylaminopyrimidine deaminase/5-amino-6-(5-phosphoribosylamino)uracil reductase
MNNDSYYMSLAIDLAKTNRGFTCSNPTVAAIIVTNYRVIATGLHLEYGKEHAEVNAINNISDKSLLINSTLYVTLEPCYHFGKTNPCVDLIISNKIKKVVIATLDPNPLVCGNSVNKLREFGIDVVVGVEEEKALELNKFFFYYIKNKLPYVTLKVASSIDGKIAKSDMTSKWITDCDARYDVHKNRFIHDAILVGANTIVYDDPDLNARLNDCIKIPYKIILDNNLKVTLNNKILTNNRDKVIIITTSNDIQKINNYKKNDINIIQFKKEDYTVRNILLKLADLGIMSILVEGGNKIYNNFINENCFNQILYYIGAKLIGGINSLQFFNGNELKSLNFANYLNFSHVEKIGNNIKIIIDNLSKE